MQPTVRNYSREYSRRFKSFGFSMIFANYASKRQLGNQETSKATPRAQLTKYLKEVATTTVPSNGFKFWKPCLEVVNSPALFKLSKHTLCTPASSAPVERIFSASGLIMRPQRARLFSEILEVHVSLKCNCNFLEK